MSEPTILSPEDISVIINPLGPGLVTSYTQANIVGIGPSGISISTPAAFSDQAMEGTGGELVYSRSGSRAGSLKLSLIPGASSIGYLSDIINAQLLTGFAGVSVLVKDNRPGGSIFQGLNWLVQGSEGYTRQGIGSTSTEAERVFNLIGVWTYWKQTD